MDRDFAFDLAKMLGLMAAILLGPGAFGAAVGAWLGHPWLGLGIGVGVTGVAAWAMCNWKVG